MTGQPGAALEWLDETVQRWIDEADTGTAQKLRALRREARTCAELASRQEAELERQRLWRSNAARARGLAESLVRTPTDVPVAVRETAAEIVLLLDPGTP